MNKRPVLVILVKEEVRVLDLVEKDGILAVPMDRGYRYVGSVSKEVFEADGMNRTRWFAMTTIDIPLGPYTTRRESIEKLLAWQNLREAQVSETSEPLF